VLNRAIDRAALSEAALRLFEAGDFQACRAVVEALSVFGLPSLPIRLAYAVSLAETGDGDAAGAIFEHARAELAGLVPGPLREQLELILGRVAERLPGGRLHKQRREELAGSAGRFVPKIPKAG
jgi:hypothetical protein